MTGTSAVGTSIPPDLRREATLLQFDLMRSLSASAALLARLPELTIDEGASTPRVLAVSVWLGGREEGFCALMLGERGRGGCCVIMLGDRDREGGNICCALMFGERGRGGCELMLGERGRGGSCCKDQSLCVFGWLCVCLCGK